MVDGLVGGRSGWWTVRMVDGLDGVEESQDHSQWHCQTPLGRNSVNEAAPVRG